MERLEGDCFVIYLGGLIYNNASTILCFVREVIVRTQGRSRARG